MVATERTFYDPVHEFVRVGKNELRLVESRPVQRLRRIHQLAGSSLVYPGASHRRFEHSLGVMELAGRIFDAITHPARIRNLPGGLPEVADAEGRRYWRLAVRLAALLHDLGHLPFSHAAEHELLPDGWSHERLSFGLILLDEVAGRLAEMDPPIRAEDVARIAVGEKKAPGGGLPAWLQLLSEIVVSDFFGADRMDYLVRDALHTGVPYGRFGHQRLLETVRILPALDSAGRPTTKLTLGVERGGVEAVEALLMARYFMFSQVYLHRVRLIYDRHLIDFLRKWLPGGRFPTDLESHLALTDGKVGAAIWAAADDPAAAGHRWAQILARREHFKTIYEPHPGEEERYREEGEAVEREVRARFGADAVRTALADNKGGKAEFPVLLRNGDLASSTAVSGLLGRIPDIYRYYVYTDRTVHEPARDWLAKNLNNIIIP